MSAVAKPAYVMRMQAEQTPRGIKPRRRRRCVYCNRLVDWSDVAIAPSGIYRSERQYAHRKCLEQVMKKAKAKK